jgi:hypothetical protein
LEPATLLVAAGTGDSGPVSQPDLSYLYDPAASIDCGFLVTSRHVVAALSQTNRIFQALPLSLFTTIDLKAQSGMVGAVFAAELATIVGAMPNPIEKGHPDIVPASAAGASEAELRNYPTGLEVKSTIGGVAKGSELGPGQARIDALVNLVWQAHHREVRALLGLVWDFVGGTRSRLSHPSITGVFHTADLLESDWGKISGTTGRNTKVTGMTVSGRRKMAVGAIAVINDARYQCRYAHCLRLPSFPGIRQCTA